METIRLVCVPVELVEVLRALRGTAAVVVVVLKKDPRCSRNGRVAEGLHRAVRIWPPQRLFEVQGPLGQVERVLQDAAPLVLDGAAAEADARVVSLLPTTHSQYIRRLVGAVDRETVARPSVHVAVAGGAFIAKLVGEAVGVLVMVVIAGSGWRWGDKSGVSEAKRQER
jgi:hypothetical protein